MAGTGETVVFRRNIRRDRSSSSDVNSALQDDKQKGDDSKQTRFALMEEVLLLGLKDREGYTSFWSDNISLGLRGCFLIELALRGRITLEPPSTRRLILNRNVIVIKNVPTGDMLLDEALRTISSNSPADVKSWIDYLSGDTWNPFKIALQMRNVRERIAKNLVEKGVCSTEKQNFILFDMTTHPLINTPAKQLVIQRIIDALLSNWTTDIQRMDKRMLSLIVVSQRADVLENAFLTLSNQDYNTATKHVRTLMDLNYNEYGSTGTPADVIWAVFAALSS
ncbi:Golgi phosphoprotein 3-like [Echinococcus granulosus]|uniref:Golgi phosphoprotein 3 n=1 Tax=Echinococcus granulosus TaxID=6210 RepID=U6IZD4_ECHGR|nr:Golgi phosphoprotein 3-like protein [Echinococcus granulosus]EUB62521.1 Golgi phosphoprotein 3-like protein [Echinococcus granulosus]KAH9282905.1 Golgi phosphoprotein 3-like [Echinococcus granulosus]CDS17109.1 Golgi phosphoprotein 3 [Echinococcus granulosus]